KSPPPPGATLAPSSAGSTARRGPAPSTPGSIGRSPISASSAFARLAPPPPRKPAETTRGGAQTRQVEGAAAAGRSYVLEGIMPPSVRRRAPLARAQVRRARLRARLSDRALRPWSALSRSALPGVRQALDQEAP